MSLDFLSDATAFVAGEFVFVADELAFVPEFFPKSIFGKRVATAA
jgi:hypothetical protein